MVKIHCEIHCLPQEIHSAQIHDVVHSALNSVSMCKANLYKNNTFKRVQWLVSADV